MICIMFICMMERLVDEYYLWVIVWCVIDCVEYFVVYDYGILICSVWLNVECVIVDCFDVLVEELYE